MLDRILPHLQKVRRSGRGYIARCPAHEDRSPSLSIREADDGRVLLHCFGGCNTADVLAALGLDMTALFPQDGRQRRRPVAPGVTRADVRAAVQLERTICFVLDADRRAGKPVADTDLERERLARQRIAASRRVL